MFLIVSQSKTKGKSKHLCFSNLRLRDTTSKAYSKIKATKSITRRFASEGKRVGVFCILCFLYPLIEDFNRKDKSFAYKTKDNNSFLCFLCYQENFNTSFAYKRKDNNYFLCEVKEGTLKASHAFVFPSKPSLLLLFLPRRNTKEQPRRDTGIFSSKG